MAAIEIRNLTFAYPGQGPALQNINLQVKHGDFVVLCGPSGCGKTTLLRHLKPELTPAGKRRGGIYINGTELSGIDKRWAAGGIGFVQQIPENQIVTDKVWHELAFGLENLGINNREIRGRVAEMAAFFGIDNWFHKNVSELSGGQKQLLNLASVMVMQPSLLILDEPTGQLDPISAGGFLEAVGKINRELGITLIMTEHRLEDAFSLADRVLVMKEGQIVAEAAPDRLGPVMKEAGGLAEWMKCSFPSVMKIWAEVEIDANIKCPVTVREGRRWLDGFEEMHGLKAPSIGENLHCSRGEFASRQGTEREKTEQRPALNRKRKLKKQDCALVLDDVWFSYGKNLPDVVKGASLQVPKGAFYTLMGGNGSGKSTLLRLAAGIKRPYRGNVAINGRTGLLPQDPRILFVAKTVQEELEWQNREMVENKERLKDFKALKGEKGKELDFPEKSSENLTKKDIVRLCGLEGLMDRHPYDLSGGEQQRLGLAKVLMTDSDILLLDEPTKGMDGEMKRNFAAIIRSILAAGRTVFMVSHDLEFCAEYGEVCGLFFDGSVATSGTPVEFFSGNSFYTTSANRMARHLLPKAITAYDVVVACCGPGAEESGAGPGMGCSGPGAEESGAGPGMACCGPGAEESEAPSGGIYGICGEAIAELKNRRPFSIQTGFTCGCLFLLIPVTMLLGAHFGGNRSYYMVSVLMIIEAMLPFFLVFEGRKPTSREIVVIAVMCGLAVAGRAAFFMLPNFKPVMAIVIITGIALGGEAGFIVGAMSMLVSNMMFGQGPWTPWQMFSMGIIGLLAGLLFSGEGRRPGRLVMCIFGAFCAVVIYGGIMNTMSALMWADTIDIKIMLTYYISGLPYDLMQAAATVLILWLMGDAVLDKLQRVKVKYGMLPGQM